MEKPKNPEKPKEEIRGIVRIAGTDVKGEKKLFPSLQRIKGVGNAYASIICKICGFERNIRIGSLADSDIKKIEDVMKNPKKYNIPNWMVNRRLDPSTGENIHLIGHDLAFVQKQDIQNMIKMKSYKGVRHMFGLPVRGQRTRSSFRKGRSVGVVRKKTLPAKASAKASK